MLFYGFLLLTIVILTKNHMEVKFKGDVILRYSYILNMAFLIVAYIGGIPTGATDYSEFVLYGFIITITMALIAGIYYTISSQKANDYKSVFYISPFILCYLLDMYHTYIKGIYFMDEMGVGC